MPRTNRKREIIKLLILTFLLELSLQQRKRLPNRQQRISCSFGCRSGFCDYRTGRCQQCYPGFQLKESVCLRCDQAGCARCQRSLSKCEACHINFGFYVSETNPDQTVECSPCSGHCVRCKNHDVCLVCDSWSDMTNDKKCKYKVWEAIMTLLLYLSPYFLCMIVFCVCAVRSHKELKEFYRRSTSMNRGPIRDPRNPPIALPVPLIQEVNLNPGNSGGKAPIPVAQAIQPPTGLPFTGAPVIGGGSSGQVLLNNVGGGERLRMVRGRANEGARLVGQSAPLGVENKIEILGVGGSGQKPVVDPEESSVFKPVTSSLKSVQTKGVSGKDGIVGALVENLSRGETRAVKAPDEAPESEIESSVIDADYQKSEKEKEGENHKEDFEF